MSCSGVDRNYKKCTIVEAYFTLKSMLYRKESDMKEYTLFMVNIHFVYVCMFVVI